MIGSSGSIRIWLSIEGILFVLEWSNGDKKLEGGFTWELDSDQSQYQEEILVRILIITDDNTLWEMQSDHILVGRRGHYSRGLFRLVHRDQWREKHTDSNSFIGVETTDNGSASSYYSWRISSHHSYHINYGTVRCTSTLFTILMASNHHPPVIHTNSFGSSFI